MGGADFSDEDDQHLSRDEKFLRKLKSIVESNLDNEHFSVKNLAEDMALSRIQLFRRTRRLTGKNVTQYIREFRLQRAMEMLKNDVATVSEIGYQVGFSSPAYFNKCFHSYYGLPPGEIVKRLDKDSKEYSKNGTVTKGEIHIDNISPTVKKTFIGKSTFWYIIVGILSAALVLLIIWYLPVIKQVEVLLKSAPATINTNEKSIAVLPFRNESPDQGNEYFSNVMQDEILNHLQKIADLSVRSRTSVEQYRDTKKDICTIGREINAAYILEGSVWKFGDNFRMSAQLIETRTDEHLWGETYDVVYSDTIFVIQTYIAKRIAASLLAVLSPEEEKRIGLRYTNDIESYDFAIRGTQEMENFFRYWDRKHLTTALSQFNNALKIDPENILALAGKANLFRIDGPRDSVIFYCDKAIKIDPGYYFSYQVKANYYNNILKYDLAIKNYLKTIELAPNNAMAYNRLGEIYFNQKKDVIRGLMHLNKSLELNVTSQPNIFYWVGMCYTHVGDYERAQKYFMKMIELDLNCDGIMQYSWCLAIRQKHEEARVFLDSICGKVDCERACIRENWYHSYCSKDFDLAEDYLGTYTEKGYELAIHWKIIQADMYIQMGREEEARPLLDECRTFFENHLEKWGEIWYNTFNLSHIYAMLGEKERGLIYLEKAIDIGMLGGWQDILEVHTVYQNLWDESEFKELVKRAKAEKAALRARIREMEERGEINL